MKICIFVVDFKGFNVVLVDDLMRESMIESVVGGFAKGVKRLHS
jgi:hypothetical protein